MQKIILWYGDGFAGRSYCLQINDKYYPLTAGLGSEEKEAEAKQKAGDILKSLNIEFDLGGVNFKWDGTL